MRIVGGRLRGRSLVAPTGRAIRPSADRLRETVFNILQHGYGDPVSGARVLDLFAGTGALGLEALSRGARHALFVDTGAEARALLRANIEALGLGGVTRIFRRDAGRLGVCTDAPFALAFLDPPYGQDLGPRALAALNEGGWLTPGALVVLEERAEVAPPEPACYALLESRSMGGTRLHFYRWESPRCPPLGGDGKPRANEEHVMDRPIIEDISRDALKQGLADGSIDLVDVREPNEFEAGHIPGATLNPLQSFDPSRLPPATQGKRIVLACRSGSRSKTALAMTQAAGRTDITTHYPGGFLEWSNSGETIA